MVDVAEVTLVGSASSAIEVRQQEMAILRRQCQVTRARRGSKKDAKQGIDRKEVDEKEPVRSATGGRSRSQVEPIHRHRDATSPQKVKKKTTTCDPAGKEPMTMKVVQGNVGVTDQEEACEDTLHKKKKKKKSCTRAGRIGEKVKRGENGKGQNWQNEGERVNQQ